ncbi:MAG: hypothetical protein V4440_00925 [Pseudomonadota bacterium]
MINKEFSALDIALGGALALNQKLAHVATHDQKRLSISLAHSQLEVERY